MVLQNVFIANTSVKILAAMYSDPEGNPSQRGAVNSAIKLWNELATKNHNVFIANTSATILAAMYSDPVGNPSQRVAVNSAIKLWKELVANEIHPEIMQ